MNIDDLLEKKEARQFHIIRRTLLAGGCISETEMIRYLKVSKASFEKDVQELTFFFTAFGDNCQLTYDGQWLTVRLATNFSAAELYRRLIKTSLKFQIIDYLYRYKEFTVAQLTTKFSISESSLFRKLKELNRLLQEFSLQIKNGQLQGEELQIRYFYFQLYWQLLSYEQHQEVTLTNQNQRLIDSLAKTLGISFNEYSQLRLGLWLTIAKKRLTVPLKQYRELSLKMATLQEDPLYQQIRQFTLRFFSQFPVEFEEGEGMLHFVFLLVSDTLSQEAFTEYALLRKRRAITSLADTMVLETIVLHYRPQKFAPSLEQKIVYYLAQVHSKLYFLKGEFLFSDYQRTFSKLSDQGQPTKRTAFVRKLLMESLACFNQKVQLESSLHQQALENFYDILIIIDENISGEVRIGLDLDLASLEKERLSQWLLAALKGQPNLQLEFYQPFNAYRLIITNHLPRKRYRHQPQIYVLAEPGSTYDLKQLQQIVQSF